MIKNFGFARTLFATIGILVLALAGTVVYSSQQLSATAMRSSEASLRLVPQLGRVAAIELNITRISLQLRHAMLARTPQEMQAALDDVGAKRKLIEGLSNEFEVHVISDKGRAMFAVLRGHEAEFWKAGEVTVGLITGGKKTEAFEYLVTTVIPLRNRFLAATSELRDYQQTRLITAVNAGQAEISSTLQALWAAVAVLTGALCVMAWRLVSHVKARVAGATASAKSIAQGDLSQEIAVDGHDEFHPLLQQLSEMRTSLASTLGQVRSATESIGTASAEIAAGNLDLSTRTEVAASSLQQTASSMAQLNGTVQQSADSARQAMQLSSSAADVAARGGSVVAQVVATMSEINTSSKRIADIIGTIDGIAFQTNILALNAAVEAARAGEHGRGFAVVASEVRTLAQRSAEAAREIKTLIKTSVEKVESGTRQVQDAGSTMDEIVASVQRVSDIIGEISAAVVEQSGGIGRVNQAVAQLDQSTQQNAALVEESAAAAESLKEQATRLADVLAAFRLDKSAGERPRKNAGPATAQAVASSAITQAQRAAAPKPASAPGASRPEAQRAAPTWPAAPARTPTTATAPTPASATSHSANDGDWESF